MLRNSQAGPNVYPGVPAEYTNWRDEQNAWQHTLRALQPVVPHGRSRARRPRRAEAALRPGREQLRELRRRQGEALRAGHAGGLRDRRRDPLPPRRELVQPGRPRAGAELDHLPRRDRRLRRDGRARPALGDADGRPAEVVPLPGAGTERDGRDREGARRAAAGAEVLQHDDRLDRREAGPSAPARHGRPARLGAVRPVGGRAAGPRGAARRRRGVRDAPGGRSRLLLEHARVGLDPVAASGRLHRRLARGVPRVAARRMATRARPRSAAASPRRTSRTTTSRPGISATAATSSSTTTSSAGTRSRRWPTASTGRR